MRIFLRFITLFIPVSFNCFATCEFRPEISQVVSLSGPATVLLKELDLLGHSKLKGISVFNPVSSKEYSGEIYPGGVFLSRGVLNELKGSVVFFDEGRELRKLLKSEKTVDAQEIMTRNLTPREAVESTLKVISSYLQGCEDKIKNLRMKVITLQNKILSYFPKKRPIVFYLGVLSNERKPEMVIANDGVVKWLRQENKIVSYPSELSYVNWSSKVLGSLPKETLHVGVKDSGREGGREIKRSSQKMTLVYPGALVPGMSQLEAFLYWAESL